MSDPRPEPGVSDPAPPEVPRPRTPLGTTSMILGWVGIATCGALSPLALIIGIVALFQTPRRHALYGVALGLAGAALFVSLVTLVASYRFAG